MAVSDCDGFLLSKKSSKSMSKTPSSSKSGSSAKKGFFKKIKAKFGLSSESSKNSKTDEDIFRDEKREKEAKNAAPLAREDQGKILPHFQSTYQSLPQTGMDRD